MAYTFGDPVEATEDLRARSPVHERLRISVVRQEQGVAVLSMPLTEDVRGAAEGSIHGGMLATLADAASGFCLEGLLDLGSHVPIATDMNIRFYQQPHDGPIVAEATVVHRDSRLLSSECSIVDAAQRVLARCSAAYMIVPIEGIVPAEGRLRSEASLEKELRDARIIELYNAGRPQRAIAKEVGWSVGVVWQVLKEYRRPGK